MVRMIKVVTLLAMWALAALPAQAQTRHALVIGIDSYTDVTPLQKARNDARAVGQALGDAGVQVDLVLDPGEVELLTRVTAFAARLRSGDEAIIFFAGHGVEVDGRNYLLPADIPAVEPGQEFIMMRRSLPLNDLLDMLHRRDVRLSLVVLDACRNNPFPRRGTRSLGGTRGLGRVDPPEGTFILFSAGAGQEALDRMSETDPEPNSVFTRALLPLLGTPGLGLRDVVQQVRRDVRQSALSIGHDQFPAVYDQLDGDFTLIPAVAVVPPPLDPCDAARADWAMIDGNAGQELLTAFLSTHSECPILVAIAQDRLAALAPSPAPQPVAVEDPCDAARLVWRLIEDSSDPDVLNRYAESFAASCPALSQQATEQAERAAQTVLASRPVQPLESAACAGAALALAPRLNFGSTASTLEEFLKSYPNCGAHSKFAETVLSRRQAGRAIVPGTQASENRMALDQSQRVDIQTMLNDIGFQSGTPDGAFGPRSRAAIKGFNRSVLKVESEHLSAENLLLLKQVHSLAPDGVDGRWLMTFLRRDTDDLRRNALDHSRDQLLESYVLRIRDGVAVVESTHIGRPVRPAVLHSIRVDANAQLQVEYTGHYLTPERPEARRLRGSLPLGKSPLLNATTYHVVGQYDGNNTAIIRLTRQSYD